MTDDFTDLLRPPSGDPDPTRTAETLAATLRVRRRSLLFRRAGWVAGAVGLFAAGGAVGWVLKPTPSAVVPVALQTAAEPAPTVAESLPLSAEQLELQAELADDPAIAARLFREAGDRFLTADRDYENAARCYRRHLSAHPDAKKVATSDSWLLLTLKLPGGSP